MGISRAGDLNLPTTQQPTIALLPWGNVLEDFL